MGRPIDTTPVQAQPIAAVRGRLAVADVPAKMMPLMDAVWAFLRANDVKGTGHNVWLYRPRPDGLMDVEVGVQVAVPIVAEGEVIASQTPGGVVAHTFHYGDYGELPGVYRAVFEWCARQGHEPAGVNWEVYGDWHDDPDKRRTDIHILLATAA